MWGKGQRKKQVVGVILFEERKKKVAVTPLPGAVRLIYLLYGGQRMEHACRGLRHRNNDRCNGIMGSSKN